MRTAEEPWRLSNIDTIGVSDIPDTHREFVRDVPRAYFAARARRVADMFGMLPRWRDTGPLTLDLFHRDARLGTRWLSLHPREFGVQMRHRRPVREA